MLLREDAESMEGWAYEKHRQIGGNDEDGPPSKVLESRGIRTLWVILVVHKIGRFGWIWNVRIEFLKGSALELSQPAHLRHGKKMLTGLRWMWILTRNRYIIRLKNADSWMCDRSLAFRSPEACCGQDFARVHRKGGNVL